MTDKVSSKQTRENNEEEETLCVHTKEGANKSEM